MQVLAYAMPPHMETGFVKCYCCTETIMACVAVKATLISAPAYNDADLREGKTTFCNKLCLLLYLSGGSRA